MWRVVLEYHGSNSGDKTVLQLMLGKKDNGQKKIRIRKVGKRNVAMPPLVLLISMSTQISLEMADAGDASGRERLENLAKALNKGSDKLAFMYMYYVSTIVICAHLIIARMRMHFLFRHTPNVGHLPVSQERQMSKKTASKAAGPMDPAVREMCLSLKYEQGKSWKDVAAALNEANHRNSKGGDYTMTGVGPIHQQCHAHFFSFVHRCADIFSFTRRWRERRGTNSGALRLRH